MIKNFCQYMFQVRVLTLFMTLGIIFGTMAAKPCIASGPDHLSLQSFTVLTEQDQLVLLAPIDIEPREDMRSILRDGAQVVLTCTAILERERTLLPRSTVATSTAAMILSYDPLSRQYVLSIALPEELERIKKAQENAEAQADGDSKQHDVQEEALQVQDIQAKPLYGHRDFNALMDNTLGRLRMPLCASSLLEDDEDYYATIQVELRHSKVPPWLSQALFFWSWDVVPSIEFSQALHGE